MPPSRLPHASPCRCRGPQALPCRHLRPPREGWSSLTTLPSATTSQGEGRGAGAALGGEGRRAGGASNGGEERRKGRSVAGAGGGVIQLLSCEGQKMETAVAKTRGIPRGIEIVRRSSKGEFSHRCDWNNQKNNWRV